MQALIVAAFAAVVILGVLRTWRVRQQKQAWQPWAGSMIAVVGIASVLFDAHIDALLGGHNWVFILETWSIYLAYLLMIESCRAVGTSAQVTIRPWLAASVVIWCSIITILFISLSDRDGTRHHFVREMFPQPQALIIALMYSAGIIVLSVLPVIWLRFTHGAIGWMLRIGFGLTTLAHLTRFIVSPFDYANPGAPTAFETVMYDMFAVFYGGVVCFALALVMLFLRRWYRESVLNRRHTRNLRRVASAHMLDVRTEESPVTLLIAIEDAVRIGDVTLTPPEQKRVAAAREWLGRAYDTGPRLYPVQDA